MYPLRVHRGGWSNWSPGRTGGWSITGLKNKDKHPFCAHIHSYGTLRVDDHPALLVFGLRSEDTRRRENVETAHGETPANGKAQTQNLL